ncbi:MAG: hypothetical protein U9N81_14450 [Bacillota bacterium]|nr:hypothetical protein [Bacillota bacterium]
MISTFALHPSASKYLIAQAVASMPEVQTVFQNGKIFIGHGTTNAFIVEALFKKPVEDIECYVSGVIAQKSACATEPENRQEPWCIEKGQIIQTDWLEFINTFQKGDIFIKGANALDSQGRVGILIGDPQGGTIGKSLGILKARGITIINPVGLEKMIPSCEEAEKHMGINKIGPHLGLKLGYICLSNTTVITETDSIKILFDLPAFQVAAGGVNGMEGSVVLAVESNDEKKLKEVINYVKHANQQKPLKIKKKSCADCPAPCDIIKAE